MSLDRLLTRWRTDPLTADNLPVWQTQPARPADLRPFPTDLPRELVAALRERGIEALYSHQAEAWERVRQGENIVLATGTASGKTLAYNLPVLAALTEQPQARALYLFPTKALAQDQRAGLSIFQASIQSLKAAIYDGDTPPSQRSVIRKNARLLFSNPDMLHTGILPHHTNWADFFRNLRFVVIDEMHTYRGVFGSHVANVLRRLKRVAAFYGANPHFILTSATIGNPRQLAEGLIEAPVTLIDQDGSSRGPRHFLIYNPPVVDPALGLRKSALLESVRLAQDLLASDVQGVVFARSRRSVEMLLTYLQAFSPSSTTSTEASQELKAKSEVRGYRSGYLPSQRREIEQGLRNGAVKLVVATNALELGIDIGGLGAALLVGYPGSIASVYQQAGRAGRGETPAVSVLIATALPLDQFLAHHPEYFFARSPEQALIDPNHLLILLDHLRCAAFELPFQAGETFGRLPREQFQEFLDFLTESGELHASDERYYWMADAYPAASVSLRSASPESVVLQVDDGAQPAVLGEVDRASAAWMAHPGAVYLHEGQQYFVQALDLTALRATLIPVALDYYTEPQRRTEIERLSTLDEAQAAPGGKAYGELQVRMQVAGFKKLRWFTNENLGEEPLDLPPTEFQTTGYWLWLSEGTLEKLRESGAWNNDPNDYGPDWPKIRERVRARDGYRCQVCGQAESALSGANGRRQLDVHHKIPFRQFTSAAEANRLDNLVTLCTACHRKAEANVRMRSGLAGLANVLGHLAPLFLMCDSGDLGVHFDPQAAFADGQPAVVLYDNLPAGIGFSQRLFELHDELRARALALVAECPCEDGCPSCVGPAGENGVGGKAEVLAILKELFGTFP